MSLHTDSKKTQRVFLVSTDADGVVCLVKASSITQATAQLLPALQASGIPEERIAALLDAGWPEERHITEVECTTRGVVMFDDGGGE